MDHRSHLDSDRISNSYSNENDSPQSQLQGSRRGSWDDDYAISPPKASIHAPNQSQSPSRILDEVFELLGTPRTKEGVFAAAATSSSSLATLIPSNVSAVLQFDQTSPISPVSPSPVLTLGLGPPQFSPDAAKASEAVYQAYGLMSLSSSISNLSLAQSSSEEKESQRVVLDHNSDEGKVYLYLIIIFLLIDIC